MDVRTKKRTNTNRHSKAKNNNAEKNKRRKKAHYEKREQVTEKICNIKTKACNTEK